MKSFSPWEDGEEQHKRFVRPALLHDVLFYLLIGIPQSLILKHPQSLVVNVLSIGQL